MKNFELPTYEKWKANSYEYRRVIGAYCCAVVRNPTSTASTDTHSYTLAVADGIIPERAGMGRIIASEFTCSDKDELELRRWYESLQSLLNDKWKMFITKTYLADDYRYTLHRDISTSTDQAITCRICGKGLPSPFVSFCCYCGQPVTYL